MNDLNFDEELLKQRIKERIYYAIDNSRETNKQSDNTMMQPLVDAHNIYNVEFYSNKRFFGKIIILTKKIVRKLMYPILIKQIHFNQRVIDQLYAVDHKINQRIDEERLKTLATQFTNEIIGDFKGILETSLEQRRATCLLEQEQFRMRLDEKIEEIKIAYTESHKVKDEIKAQLYSDIASSVFRGLANLEEDNKRRYQLFLLALKENPENIEIEADVLKTFERLHKSELKSNDIIQR